tara:strand:+ start:105 stop:368 length:264 start_codon:yes stop_codon:yes gene_type:complete
MPKYFYTCSECDAKIECYHGMMETKEDCPECEISGALKKTPSSFSLQDKNKKDNKVGQVVKAAIRDFQEELEDQKNNLKNGYYNSDE